MLVTAPLLATTKPTPNAGSCTSACRRTITASPVQPHLTLLLHTCSCTSARRNTIAFELAAAYLQLRLSPPQQHDRRSSRNPRCSVQPPRRQTTATTAACRRSTVPPHACSRCSIPAATLPPRLRSTQHACNRPRAPPLAAVPCRQAAAAHRRTSDRRRTLALAPQPFPCSPQHACVCLATQQPHVNPHACRCLSAAAQCWYVCESESAEQGPERQKKIIISLFFRYFGCKP